MKRNEVKKALENEINTVFLSDNLKEKTLQKIRNDSTSSFRIPYWVKSCAAVLVVSCLCLTLYLNRLPIIATKNFDNSSSQNSTAGEVSENIKSNNFLEGSSLKSSILQYSEMPSSVYSAPEVPKQALETAPKLRSMTISPNASEIQDIEDTAVTSFDFSSNTLKSTFISEDTLNIGDNESKLLNTFPTAEKTESGYIVVHNETKTEYIIKDGIIVDILSQTKIVP